MDGFININKPKEFTSHDVLNVLKRSFRGMKIGHGGTLDPGATGVLPVCLGKATKLQDYIMGSKKTYEAVIVFGCDSPTLDKDGEVTITDPDFTLDQEALTAALESFVGEIEQVPPMVSAIKKNGVPLYKLAQKGKEVERAPRTVTIHQIEIKSVKPKAPLPTVRVKITCSKGTYIRSLARDLGQALGTTAIIEELSRTATGAFHLADAYTLEEITAMASEGDYTFLRPMEEAVTHLTHVVFPDLADVKNILSGNSVNGDFADDDTEIYAMADRSGSLLALGKREEDRLKPFKILYGPRFRRKPMAIWRNLDEIDILPHGTAVALGNFDGVHCGHQYLIEHMASSAERSNFSSVVLSFEPHPAEFFQNTLHKYLQIGENKLSHISALGPDAALILPFDQSIARMSPQTFAEEILVRQLDAKSLWVGYNFRFGKDAAGNSQWLQEFGMIHGIEVHILDKLTYRGDTISSSAIKACLKNGDLDKANRLLGYSYHCCGEVVYGNQIGRTIGFPTANVAVDSSLFLPCPGIYITWISYDGKRHPSVTNVGHRPTVGEGLDLTVEVHILDDKPNLYGKTVEVTFLSRIRGEEKFDHLDGLKAQIASDREVAEGYFLRRGRLG